MGILKKPHPFIFNTFSVLVPSVITFLIIVLLAPSYFQDLDAANRWMAAILTALFVALCIGVSVSLLRKLLPITMNEDTWTVGKEMLLILFVVFIIIIGISTLLLILQYQEDSIFSLVLNTASITMGISLFPIIITVLFEQYRHQKSQVRKAALLTVSLTTENQKLKTTKGKSAVNFETLLIKSENQNIELKLEPRDLVFIRSDGNYLEVYYQDASEIKNKLIRNRMKSMTTMLPNTIFIRCHRSFIVNGNYIIKVEGNARNLELKLKGISDKIPVSRAKVDQVSQFLKAF